MLMVGLVCCSEVSAVAALIELHCVENENIRNKELKGNL